MNIRICGLTFTGLLLSSVFSWAQSSLQMGGGTSINAGGSARLSVLFKVLPVTSYWELPSLPPEIEVSYEQSCNQKFLKIVRHDIEESLAAVKIVLGVLVAEDQTLDCVGSTFEKALAGKSFSGRNFEIHSIH